MLRIARQTVWFFNVFISFMLFCGVAIGSTVDSPDAVVRRTTEDLLLALAAEKGMIDNNPDRIYELVREVVLPHMDIQRMAKWVLGQHWRKANAEQRERFSQEFEALLLHTYGTAFSAYTNQKIKYFPSKVNGDDKKRLVRIEIQQQGGPAISVGFSMYLKDGKWLVYDFKIEGISLVSTFRSNFVLMVRRDGIEKLIADMSAKNQKQTSPL